jgi:hypothetical protein
MGGTDVPAGTEEVFHIPGIKTAVGDTERRRRRVENGRFLGGSQGFRMVIIHRPAAVGNDILKTTT